MAFTGEQFFMGKLASVGPDDSCRVLLKDGREMDVEVGYARSLYRLEPGERVCVSVQRGKKPVLTGYLTSRRKHA